MLMLQPNVDRDRLRYLASVNGMEDRVTILRREITIYRQQLRQSFDPEFVAIYARELAAAQCELARLLGHSGTIPS